MDNEAVMKLFSHLIVLFTAMPVHECAHAWAAEKLGDDTAKRQGRVTLNPLAHLSLWGSLLLIFAGFGWGKPVQIDARNFKNPRKGMMLSALAGPASNLVLAFISMIVVKCCYFFSVVNESMTLFYVSQAFLYVMLINISLAVFNFLPIPPLDGSKIFNAILPEELYFKIMRYEQYIFLAVMALVWSGLLDKPLGFLSNKVILAMDFLTGWVTNILGALFT